MNAASVGSDFQPVSCSVSFAPGETVKTIPIVVTGDLVGEPDAQHEADRRTIDAMQEAAQSQRAG